MNNALILTFSFPFVDSSLLKPGPQVDRDTGIYLILDYVGSCQSHYTLNIALVAFGSTRFLSRTTWI